MHSQYISENINQKRLSWALLGLRLSIFLVMFVWALDKFVNPSHATRVFEFFYFIDGVPESVVNIIGVGQILLVLAFVVGFAKFWTYGIVFILHGGSTLSALTRYFDAFNNLLFFAAWPMWAACLTLFLLRDADTLFVLKK